MDHLRTTLRRYLADDPTPADDEAHAVAVQADGKIVAAGVHAVARFNPDGSPDPTFNGTGNRSPDPMGPTPRSVSRSAHTR
ncbi:MAG TPA: delta-60 repeat domain-containing protein [Gemmataceae bacterium]|jgi:hypothetical protein|nr:delta-60 repeat domain-containing protein [Gemmataceae bacterium]